MKSLTIHNIPDSEYPFFVELINKLGFSKKVSISEEEPTKEQILDGLRDAVEEVNLIKTGKKKGVLLKDFLNEL